MLTKRILAVLFNVAEVFIYTTCHSQIWELKNVFLKHKRNSIQINYNIEFRAGNTLTWDSNAKTRDKFLLYLQ